VSPVATIGSGACSECGAEDRAVTHGLLDPNTACAQAHTAWYLLFPTVAGPIASTLVGIVAVSIAYLGPRKARRAKIRASIYYLGHALAATYVVRASLRKAHPGDEIVLQEVLDKSEPAMTALDQFFKVGIDEETLIKLALDLHAGLTLFRGFLSFGVSSGSKSLKAAFVRARFVQLEPAFASILSKFERLARHYGVEIHEEPLKGEGATANA
jgi:hypothetical protein